MASEAAIKTANRIEDIVNFREDEHRAWIRDIIDAAILAEREACAVACETIGKDIVCPEECAAAIRNRKEQPDEQ